MKKFIFTFGLILGVTTLTSAQTSAPPYGMNQLEAYSIFHESYRGGDYELALTYGQWILDGEVREIQGYNGFSYEAQLGKFVDIYSGMATDLTDPAEKMENLNKALEIFDVAEETLTDEEMDSFAWTMDRARLYHDHSRTFENGTQRAFDHYIEAFNLDPQRFTEMSDGYFAKLLLNYYVSRGNQADAFAMIEMIEENATPDLLSAIATARNELISDPAQRIDYLMEGYEDADDKEAILLEVRDLHEELGNSEEAFAVTQQLYEMNPSYENTKALAENAIDNADYDTALEYLDEALENAPSLEERRNIALEITDTYRNLDNLQEARRYARRAIEIDPNWGHPYLRMAAIYASSVNQCTQGRTMNRRDQVVYWLVLDYLNTARQRDASVQATANQQHSTYTAYAPDTEDIFFEEWTIGDSISINSSLAECYGWINETTTIRAE